MKTLMVSSAEEAIKEARRAFEGGDEFVLAEGAATVGGVMFEANFGTILMHRSGRYISIAGKGEIEGAKEKLRTAAIA